MTASYLPRTLLGRALAGSLLAVAGGSLTGCSSSSEEPSAPQTSDAPPFAVKFEGPENASPGDEVTLTVTNVGRLPDSYQLTAQPLDAARVATPNFTASPAESVEVDVRIKKTPVSLVLESVGGGAGERVGELIID